MLPTQPLQRKPRFHPAVTKHGLDLRSCANMDHDANGMAHEDIWDDSALVNSWNEALAEYKVRSEAPIPTSSRRPGS